MWQVINKEPRSHPIHMFNIHTCPYVHFELIYGRISTHVRTYVCTYVNIHVHTTSVCLTAGLRVRVKERHYAYVQFIIAYDQGSGVAKQVFLCPLTNSPKMYMLPYFNWILVCDQLTQYNRMVRFTSVPNPPSPTSTIAPLCHQLSRRLK